MSGSTVVRPEGMPSVARLYADTARRAASAAALGRLRGDGPGPADGRLADVVLEVTGVPIDLERLTGYQHLVGEPGTDVVPPGYVHATAFPLAIALMNRDDFPLSAAGMVHVANRVEQRRPVLAGEPLDLRVSAADLRPHPRGTQVDLVAQVAVPGDGDVWRGVSTYLARGTYLAGRLEGGEEEPSSGPATPSVDVPDLPHAIWKLKSDTGRRFAAVSGDVNPIHLSALSAKAFGFRRTIAHGMYTAARALAVAGTPADGRFTWTVGFGSPLFLPSTVALRVNRPSSEGARAGVVWSPGSGRVHLSFEVDALR